MSVGICARQLQTEKLRADVVLKLSWDFLALAGHFLPVRAASLQSATAAMMMMTNAAYIRNQNWQTGSECMFCDEARMRSGVPVRRKSGPAPGAHSAPARPSTGGWHPNGLEVGG